MNITFLNKLLKMIKQHKTEGKSKLQNELIIIESTNILLDKYVIIA